VVASAATTLLATGCGLQQWVDNGFKVGPNYSRPPAPTASAWIDFQDPRVKSEPRDLSEWWRVFNDPALDSLIETAYQQNLTLRVAGSRILEAQAVRGIAAGSIFPQTQQAFGEYTRNKLSDKVANPAPNHWFQNWEGGLTASWELDVWGRFRRAIEAADAELDASVENYDDVLVILLADIATNYVQYRTFQERLLYARQNVEIHTKAYQLAVDKFQAGATTERDVHQAKQVLEQTRATIPALEAGLRQANNALCVLLGMPPENLNKLLGDQGMVPVVPADVGVGVPADLIRRRPDIRRAERLVAAQSARIGIAESDLYPHFSLNGTIGLSAEHFGDLFKTPGSMFGSIGPAFRWDILNYGRLLNAIQVQDARFQQLAFAYQDSVLQAGREAENAIYGFLKAQEQTAYQKASADAAQRTLEITREQYRLGAVDFTPVFLFESTLAQQQDLLAVAKGNIALNLISIYRSLGGGWDMRLKRAGGHGCSPATITVQGPNMPVAAQGTSAPAAIAWEQTTPVTTKGQAKQR
jgi:NodT family efflux transporter outer membrane factor (OMF) lipoprotein